MAVRMPLNRTLCSDVVLERVEESENGRFMSVSMSTDGQSLNQCFHGVSYPHSVPCKLLHTVLNQLLRIDCRPPEYAMTRGEKGLVVNY
jgi:hypothetical protein